MAAIKVGTRVVNQYTLSDHCGKHGVVIPFKSRIAGWSTKFSYIRYDDGTEDSEMRMYLMREDELNK